jgi:hypothetical protein
MFRLKPLAVALAAVTLISTAAAAMPTPVGPVRAGAASSVRVTAHPFDLMNDGVFGCRITINARNDSNTPITIKLGESRSKVRMGLWNTWNRESNWVVGASSTESRVVELSMMCDAGARLYQFMLWKSGNEKIIDFPADGDPTSATTISLGNLGRHF